MRTDNPLQSSKYKPLRTRDLEVLSWICEQCVARMDHVTALIGLSEAMAQEAVTRLSAAGLLERQRYIVGEPTWLVPTRSGLNAWGGGGRVFTPRIGQLAHFAAINEVRLRVQRQKPEAEWICERQLRRERSEAGENRDKHIPDAVMLVKRFRVAVEVELHFKGRKATEAVLEEHERNYDGAFYFCARGRPYKQLVQLAESGRFRLQVREL